MNKFLSIILLFFFSILSTSEITFYCDDYPPYNYKGENHAAGIAVEVLKAMFHEMQEDFRASDVKIVPWTRGYYITLRDPNTCLFSMTRTEEREEKFSWVGPIIDTKVVLIARKDKNIKIDRIEDLSGYKIAAIKNDIGELTLLEKGIKSSNIDLASNNKSNIFKLKKGRVDLWSYEENVASLHLFEQGENLDEYESVFTLKTGELYFAFNNQTSPIVIKKFQDALDKLKIKDNSGMSKFDKIIMKQTHHF
jgi:ABC-type amino acid transport substrate-binding protein